MRKAGIGLILLAAVVAISYLNAARNESKGKRQFQEGYTKGAQEAKLATQRADSLESAVSRSQALYADSLRALQAKSQSERDSLAQIVSQREEELAALKQRAKATKGTQASTKSPAAAQSGIKHAQILSFYQKKLDALPKDLSEPERQIALAEVREETARKFSISVGELDKIRQNAHQSD